MHLPRSPFVLGLASPLVVSCGRASASSLVTTCSITPDGQDGPPPDGRLVCVSSGGQCGLVVFSMFSACNHCASMSLRFSRQLVFSIDIQWTSLVSPPTVEPIPWSSRVVSEPTGEFVCCVAAVSVLHHCSNQASTDAWSGLQCGNSRRWLQICSGCLMFSYGSDR